MFLRLCTRAPRTRISSISPGRGTAPVAPGFAPAEVAPAALPPPDALRPTETPAVSASPRGSLSKGSVAMCVNLILYARPSSAQNRSSPRKSPSGALPSSYDCTNGTGLVSNFYKQLRSLGGRLGRSLWYVVFTLLVVVALFGLGIAVYLAHVRASASALINSAREIRTTSDAEREIAAWKRRSGNHFWQESDQPGGDHNYDAQIANLAIARLHLVRPTAVTVGITMRSGRLRCVTVIEMTGWQPVTAVAINEWFDSGMPSRTLLREGHSAL